MFRLIQKTLVVSVAIVSYLMIDDLVHAGCLDVAQMCIWDADANVVKACASFSDGMTRTVCRQSGNYSIAYEMKVFSTFQGFSPCFEVEGNDCLRLNGLYIKTCRQRNTSNQTSRPICTTRKEMLWRYFSFGNHVRRNGTDGVGDVFGRPYSVGTDKITTMTMSDSSDCDETTNRTTTIVLRESCQGGENYVLT